MNEKEAIEKATVDAFIKLYNSETGSSFGILARREARNLWKQAITKHLGNV